MQILVAYASRMGSTEEIARVIATELKNSGHTVEVASCEVAPDAWKVDALIVGSAIYLGRWDKSALRYLKRQSQDLADRPVWLFQSGPVGDAAESEQVQTPHAVREIATHLNIAPPITFGGRLDPTKATGPLSHWVATGRYEGDFRDWSRIRQWTASINTVLADVADNNAPAS